jgi:hypothetical protein
MKLAIICVIGIAAFSALGYLLVRWAAKRVDSARADFRDWTH